MKKGFEFLILLLVIFIIGLNFISAGVPTFITIPANSSLWYGNQSLDVVFNATNDSAFGGYYVNDTRFSITQLSNLTENQTARLINATPLAVGNYTINVTINSSGNNKNWTFYKVQINKSNYFDCGVYFNVSTPQTYPTNFSVFTNCSSTYQIYRNDSPIANNSVVNSGKGYYNLTVQRTDTANYTNTVMSQFFTVNINDEKCQVFFNLTSPQTYPKTFLAWANCTSAFVLKRNGTTIGNNSVQNALAVTAYNFSVFRNDTVNYTYTFNYSQFVINPDTTAPTYSQNSTSNTFVDMSSVFAIYVEDDSSLIPNESYSSGTYIFSTNDSGVWANDSAINFTTTPSWANVTKTINSTAGKLIGYRWFFNDTSFNTNSTPIYVLTTTQEETVNNEKSGTTTSSSQTYTVDEKFSGVGNEYNLKVSDKIKFTVGSMSHSLTLTKFNPTTATVSIASTPITAYLQKGVLYTFDLNGDSVKDINVRYNGLVGTKASIFIQAIKQSVAPEPVAEEETNVDDITSDQGAEAGTSLDEGQKWSSTTKIILIVIGAVIILSIALFFLIRKKRK